MTVNTNNLKANEEKCDQYDQEIAALKEEDRSLV